MFAYTARKPGRLGVTDKMRISSAEEFRELIREGKDCPVCGEAKIEGRCAPCEEKYFYHSRLAHLPDNLKAKASEFLSLHEAWDTDWRAILVPSTIRPHAITDEAVMLIWSRMGKCSAMFTYRERLGWEIGVTEADSCIPEFQSRATCITSNLRRSADFAEFVQRFRWDDFEDSGSRDEF